jgi:hypothetical protein
MLNIKYTKLNYKIKLKQNSVLPENKTSALRGGMGQVLMSLYCIGNKECNSCKFQESCVVQNIMYPKPKTNLQFLSNNSPSIPEYIIECLDSKTKYKKEEEIHFTIILFASTIAYIPQFIYAFDKLGQIGIGKNRYKYELLKVTSEEEKKIFENKILFKENIKITTVQQYVNERKKEIDHINTMEFVSPFRLILKGKPANSIEFKDILMAISRRLVILNAMENNEIKDIQIISDLHIESDDLKWFESERYSSTQKSKMKFGGLKGKIQFLGDINEYKDYLIACELTHIGKNTVFGLGKYILE